MERIISEVLDFLGIAIGSFIVAGMLNKVLEPIKRKNLGVIFFVSINIITHGLFMFCVNFPKLFPNETEMLNIKSLVILAFWCFYVFAFHKGAYKEKIKTYISLEVFTLFFEITISILMKFILGGNYDTVMARGSIFRGIVFFIVFSCIYLLSSVCTYVFCKRYELKVSNLVLLLFSVVVFLCCSMVAFAANVIVDSKDNSLAEVFLAVPIVFVLIYIFNYYLVVKLGEKEKLKEKLYWMENLKSVNMSYYEDVQKKYDEMRRFRHDVKDNLQILDSLIKNGDKESVKKAEILLNSYNSQVEDSKIKHFTDNVVVNTIVTNEAENAEKFDVDFKAEINIPGEIKNIELIDVNCVYLNIIRNAIEAASRVEKGLSKFVEVHSSIKSGFLFIKTVNSYESVKYNRGKIETSKANKDNHGIGISLIEEISKKYEGNFKMEFKDNVCTATLALKI